MVRQLEAQSEMLLTASATIPILPVIIPMIIFITPRKRLDTIPNTPTLLAWAVLCFGSLTTVFSCCISLMVAMLPTIGVSGIEPETYPPEGYAISVSLHAHY